MVKVGENSARVALGINEIAGLGPAIATAAKAAWKTKGWGRKALKYGLKGARALTKAPPAVKAAAAGAAIPVAVSAGKKIRDRDVRRIHQRKSASAAVYGGGGAGSEVHNFGQIRRMRKESTINEGRVGRFVGNTLKSMAGDLVSAGAMYVGYKGMQKAHKAYKKKYGQGWAPTPESPVRYPTVVKGAKGTKPRSEVEAETRSASRMGPKDIPPRASRPADADMDKPIGRQLASRASKLAQKHGPKIAKGVGKGIRKAGELLGKWGSS